MLETLPYGVIELRSGCLAYLDSFAGLVPCRVLSIGPGSLVMQSVRVEITAKHGPYHKGETVETNGLHAVPRKAVYCRGGHYKIRHYDVIADSSEV